MAVAVLIAVPIAYYYMELWLSKFAFRVELGIMIFIVAGGSAFIVGALTVGYKYFRAAILNPIKTLRDE